MIAMYARAPFHHPHPGWATGGPRPARSELGARQVEELLWQIVYGLPA